MILEMPLFIRKMTLVHRQSSLPSFLVKALETGDWRGGTRYQGHPEFPVNPNISEKLRSESCQEEDKSRTPNEKSSYKMYVSVRPAAYEIEVKKNCT